jgi:Rps23 Pro-64 3,4-dihydroxylase Tpa1-like proline 4-hydroxylase
MIRGRKLTAILYLNKEWEGGQLRLHLPLIDETTPVPESQQPSVSVSRELNTEKYLDIDPNLGRLVIFRRFVLNIC